MAHPSGLRRGEWRVVDTRDGFSLTIRPRIGWLAVVVAIQAAVFMAISLGLALFTIGDFMDHDPVAWATAFGASAVVFVTVLSVASFVWLAYGWTTIEACGDRYFIEYARAATAQSSGRLVDMQGTQVDPSWAYQSLIGRYATVVVNPRRGPLAFVTWDGFSEVFGGNISLESASAICDELRARSGASVSFPDAVVPLPVSA